jgi:hypothetical protein
MSQRKELAALKNLLSEVDLILSTTKSQRTVPPGAASYSAPLWPLPTIFSPSPSPQRRLSPWGRKGGSVIAKRGSDCFRKLAAKHKTHGGGRPRKESD